MKKHSAAFSELLLPGYAATDNSRKMFLRHEGLRQLTEVRRVVFPLKHSDFALDNDDLSHGARAWANLLGLMCANAWLEQRNRKRVELASSEEAIVAEPEDYRVAYKTFKATCARTVVNLSEVHRKILDALYDLQEEELTRDGFPQRQVAQTAGVSQSTVSANKTFLVQSVKFVVEREKGLALVAEAEPSWWEQGDIMRGIPTPEQVETWWDSRTSPDGGAEGADHADQGFHPSPKGRVSAENGDRHSTDHQSITDHHPTLPIDTNDRDRQVIDPLPVTENGLDKPSRVDKEGVIGMIGYQEDLKVQKSIEAISTPGSGPANTFQLFRAGRINSLDFVAGSVSAYYQDDDGWGAWVELIVSAALKLDEGQEQ